MVTQDLAPELKALEERVEELLDVARAMDAKLDHCIESIREIFYLVSYLGPDEPIHDQTELHRRDF